MACGEFSLITRYFDRVRSSHLDTELDIGDDCALLSIPEEQTLAISADTLVTGNRFPPDIDLADLVYKTLTVDLSDLAAMGVDPARLMLALTLPDVDRVWLESFSDSLFGLLNYYDIQLVGGDTMRRSLPVTLDVRDFVPTRRALARSGVKSGGWIYVTGTPGDSTAGLTILQNRLQVVDVKGADYLIKRHLHSSPRILQEQALRDLASLAIDPSDGLISDSGHIMKTNDCGVRIDLVLLPFSDVLSRHVEPEQTLRWAFSGGEDYELCLMVPEPNHGALGVALGHLGVPFTRIGQTIADIERLCFTRDDEPVTLDQEGYDHFVTP